MSVVPRTQTTTGPGRLYCRCLVWGIATGAVTGTVTGAFLGVTWALGDGYAPSLVGLPVVGAFYGVIVGTIVSIVPSTLGGLAVIAVLQWRHPHPASPPAVKRDMGVIFCVLVAVLDVPLVVAIFAGGLSSVAEFAPFLATANASIAVMLLRARTSITRAWSKDNGDAIDSPWPSTWPPAP